MRAHRFVVVVSAASLTFVATACSKTDASSGGSAATAGSATTTSALVAVTYNKSTFPPKGTHAVTTTAHRGGTGGIRPATDSKKLTEHGTDRMMRQPATADVVDCTKTPDNAAECDGDKMYYCDDQQLWMVDCNAEAKQGGVAGGSCFEAETFTECLGCDTASDGSSVCCDFEMSVCCDKDGACYSPKG